VTESDELFKRGQTLFIIGLLITIAGLVGGAMSMIAAGGCAHTHDEDQEDCAVWNYYCPSFIIVSVIGGIILGYGSYLQYKYRRKLLQQYPGYPPQYVYYQQPPQYPPR
jgi:hypothetical protein